MTKKQATIQDIARMLNITASTVSRALNDHPKIKQSTKDHVWEKAKELHYQPNTIASSLRKGKVNTVGMIVPRINRHFFSNVITGVESVLNPAGYNLIICQSEEKIEKEIENTKTLIANRVSGILISISVGTNDTKHLNTILNNHIPLVMFDRIADQFNVNKVVNDDESGAYDLTNHLISQGYKKIMWMGGPLSSYIYNNRYNGYKRALKEANIPPEEMPCFEGSAPTLDVALKFMQEFIKQNQLPEAIFAASDYMSMGVIQALQQNGYKIPEDIAVAGYSNEPFAELISPKLTTVEQFSEELGRSTARLLLEQIKSGYEEIIPRKIVLKPKLIIRESTINKQKKTSHQPDNLTITTKTNKNTQ
jgi:LacI family transcriptional regulator